MKLECHGQGGHVYIMSVITRGDFIVVADVMKSLSLFLYKSIDNTIEIIARDYNTTWMSAAEIIDDDTFVGQIVPKIFLLFVVTMMLQLMKKEAN